MMPATKLSRLKDAMRAEDWRTALRIAAYFPDLGEHKEAITRAWNALNRPSFYRQLGRDPEALVEDGKRALVARYG